MQNRMVNKINTPINMRKFIRVKPETRDQIMAKYGVTRQTVWESLNFVRRCDRADKIRKDALAMGGRYFEEDFIPDCSFQRTTNGWIQRFATGVVVTVVGSKASISKGDETIAEYDEVTLRGMSNILAQAQLYAEHGIFDLCS